jgi:peptide/nickel transport system permease protein
VLHHLVLPTLTLALVYLAQYSRLARASMLDVLGSDFIRTARAKGLAEGVVLYKHALRNAVLPVITILGLQFGNVMAGAILVETVFNWPGLGRLAFESVLRRDYPTILGVLLFSSVVVVIMNQLTDLAYRLVDPRIKVS